MRNLLVEMRFNGSRYHGFQVQENALSITEVVQDAIEKVFKKREPIVGCSRTDTGVHANSYFFNMKTESKIPCDKFLITMNNNLPRDIAVVSCKEVSLDFHSRYDCKGKEYIYRIYNAPVKDPFQAEFSLFHQKPIDEKLLNQCAQAFVGTHDFSAFCSKGGKLGENAKANATNVRTIEYINVFREGSIVTVRIKADGFLYNMVRIIVGTLLFINDGRIGRDAIPSIISCKDRILAGKTVAPQGLYLNSVEY